MRRNAVGSVTGGLVGYRESSRCAIGPADAGSDRRRSKAPSPSTFAFAAIPRLTSKAR